MKAFLINSVLFFISFISYAQVSISEFLQSSLEAVEVKTATAQLSYLQTKPYKLSPLQKFEFRTKNRELSPHYQQYAFRFTPSNPWEVRSSNRYFAEYESLLELNRELALKNALVERYSALIAYFYYKELKELSNENLELINRQLKIIENQSGTRIFNADEFVKLKIDQLNKTVEMEEAEYELINSESLINDLYPDSYGKKIDMDVKQLITIEKIEQVIDSLRSEEESNSISIEYHQQKVNVDRSRYNLEKNNFNLGFLQTEYDNRRAYQERTPFNIGLGITIPITNPNKGDMARRKLEEIESQYELNQVQESNRIKVENSFTRLKDLIGSYKNLQTKFQQINSSTMPSNLALLKEGDPGVFLQFEEGMHKLKLIESKLRRRILIEFIDYLSASEHIIKKPYTNYLSNRLVPLGF
jgi:hypothetical protein